MMPAAWPTCPSLIWALTPHFKPRTTADWLEMLEKAGVPAGPVLSIAEMHAHPQTKARNMVPTVEHAKAGQVQTIGLPVKFSAGPGTSARGARYTASTRASCLRRPATAQRRSRAS